MEELKTGKQINQEENKKLEKYLNILGKEGENLR
jgi:hypothetical protein